MAGRGLRGSWWSLAVWCQLRWQELAALQRDHFNIQKTGVSYVTINQAVTEPKGQGRVIKATKNEEIRRVSIPPHIIPAIRWHLNTFVGPHREAWFFTGEKGAPLRKGNWYNEWKSGRDTVADQLPRDFHFHDLRHTGGTYFARTGATVREIMDRMGQLTPRAAMIYQHSASGGPGSRPRQEPLWRSGDRQPRQHAEAWA